jgi:hypothetical protein
LEWGFGAMIGKICVLLRTKRGVRMYGPDWRYGNRVRA